MEITVAVVDAVYSFATPGVNAPNAAGAPSVSASVAGTVPPAVPSSWSPPSCDGERLRAADRRQREAMMLARSSVSSWPGAGRTV